MNIHKWTKKKDRILELYYPKHGSIYCSKILNISRCAITARARRIKVKFIIPQSKNGFIKCSKCKILKSIKTDFSLDRNAKRGFTSQCRKCRREKTKEHYLFNINKTRKHQREYARLWRKKNKKHFLKWRRNRHHFRQKTEPMYRIEHALRGLVRRSIKGKGKSAHTMELLGCSINEFKKHIESQFANGMSWENYGKEIWHLDHIKAVCEFTDLSLPEQQRECCHYTNLRPLWTTTEIAEKNGHFGIIGNLNRRRKY